MTSVPSAQRVARRHLGRLYRGALRRALAPAALPAPRDLRRQQQEVDGLRREVQAAHRRLAELGASLDALPSPEQLQATAADVERRLEALDLLLGADSNRSTRLLRHHQALALAREVTAVTGAEKPWGAVAAAYRTAVDLELHGIARIAGGLTNVVGKLATVPLLRPPSGEVLEIGVLYGLFAAGLHRQLARTGAVPSLTLVDPFAGVQLQPGTESATDPTGSPVSETVARRNLALGGVPADGFRLVTGYSGDAAVRAQVADRRYGVVVVDGDHSFEGVRADLLWVQDLLEPGGVVVLDDYGDPRWPGVQQATDEHLREHTGLRMLGRVSTSAFLRRVD
ncbi:class I SAM-dependent methyltransferase [Angustibacter aerolatus]